MSIVLMLGLVLVAGALLLFYRGAWWLSACFGGLGVGPLLYAAIGFGLARFAPPGRIRFFSIPLPASELWWNVGLWVAASTSLLLLVLRPRA